MRDSLIVFVLLIAGLLAGCGGGGSDNPSPTAKSNPFFPVSQEFFWYYNDSDQASHFGEPHSVDGENFAVLIYPLGDKQYYVADEAALALKGFYSPSVDVSGFGSLAIDILFSTPIQLFQETSQPASTQQIDIQGKATIDSSHEEVPVEITGQIDYHGVEDLHLSLGAFTARHIGFSLNINTEIEGSTISFPLTSDIWLVERIGIVKHVENGAVFELTDFIGPDGDGDGVADAIDAFPGDPAYQRDTDRDGIADSLDPDDDGDGVADEADRFPTDPAESSDFDGDGQGDNADPDDDDDGLLDDVDPYPYDAENVLDTDNDGLADEVDPDDDNDGVVDEADLFPTDPEESSDFDGDGVGDNGDSDDDNDGFADDDDSFPLTQPKMVQVAGNFFTQDPSQIVYPVKVLFAIDCSLGMLEADPASPPDAPLGRRIAAVEAFIEQFNAGAYPTVSFGILLWADDVIDRTQEFTRSKEELSRVLSAVNHEQGRSYRAALGGIYHMLDDDIIENSGSGELSATQYVICFLSSGEPHSASAPESAADIQTYTEELFRLVTDEGVGSLKVETFFLSTLFRNASGDYLEAAETVAAREEAKAVLMGLAQRGNGSFLDVAAPAEIDFIEALELQDSLDYEVKLLMAYNLNVLPGGALPQEDSDGDGLSDREEVSVAEVSGKRSDPTTADTDRDGMSDFLERRISSPGQVFDPTIPDGPCPAEADWTYLDTDGDGMNDCDEYVIGTHRSFFDSDRDFFGDYVEFLYRSNPKHGVENSDTDFDGVSDSLEMMEHTNLHLDDTLYRSQYAYRYEVVDQGIDPQSDRRRYEFSVSNLAILDTGGSKVGGVQDLSPGDNRILLVIAQVPKEMPNAPPLFSQAEVVLNYHTDTQEIELLPGDFQLLP